jgi:hypothetical protein
MMQERVKKMRTHAEAQEGPDPGFESAVYPPWVPKSLRTRTGCRRRSTGRAPPPEPVVDRRLTIDPTPCCCTC